MFTVTREVVSSKQQGLDSCAATVYYVMEGHAHGVTGGHVHREQYCGVYDTNTPLRGGLPVVYCWEPWAPAVRYIYIFAFLYVFLTVGNDCGCLLTEYVGHMPFYS